MVLAYDAHGNFRKQLRLGIFATGFHQLPRHLGHSTGHPNLIDDGCRCNGVRRRVPRCLDQRGHKPIHDDAGQLRMGLEQIRSMVAGGWNFAKVEGFIHNQGASCAAE